MILLFVITISWITCLFSIGLFDCCISDLWVCSCLFCWVGCGWFVFVYGFFLFVLLVDCWVALLGVVVCRLIFVDLLGGGFYLVFVVGCWLVSLFCRFGLFCLGYWFMLLLLVLFCLVGCFYLWIGRLVCCWLLVFWLVICFEFDLCFARDWFLAVVVWCWLVLWFVLYLGWLGDCCMRCGPGLL